MTRRSFERLHAVPVSSAFLTLVSVWVSLALGGLADRCGLRHAVPASFAFALALIVATRPTRRRGGARARDPLVFVLGCVGGAGTSAVITLGVLALGAVLGMPAATAPPMPPDVLAVAATLALAPCFEELLYRERIPDALASLPRSLRVVSSSALFALPHVEPWRVLGAFVVGILLGATRERTGAIGLCIGLHVGLNASIYLDHLHHFDRMCDDEPGGALAGATAAGVCARALVGALAWALAMRRARNSHRFPNGQERHVACSA